MGMGGGSGGGEGEDGGLVGDFGRERGYVGFTGDNYSGSVEERRDYRENCISGAVQGGLGLGALLYAASPFLVAGGVFLIANGLSDALSMRALSLPGNVCHVLDRLRALSPRGDPNVPDEYEVQRELSCGDLC
jgi:hypothetical protein